MTEKEKGKHNPFIGVLQDDEEILWFYTSPSSWESVEMLKRTVRIAIMFLFGFLIALCAAFLVQGMALHYDALASQTLLWMSLGTVVFTVLYGFVMLYPFSLLRASPNHAYSVTNKRLLTSIAEKVTMLNLDDVDMLHMSSSEEGHVFFSASMPEWRHIPHPEDVIKIIQQAKRMQRLSIEHEDAHGEETEEQVQSLREDAASR